MVIEIDAPLLKWGNSYALRITRKQAEALGARPGVPLHATIEACGKPRLVVPTFRPASTVTIDDLDDLAMEQAEEDLDGRRG